MLMGLPTATRELLLSLVWMLPVCAAILALFLVFLLPGAAVAGLAAAVVPLGVLLGLYGTYRSRFAVAQALTTLALGVVFFMVLGVGAVTGLCAVLGQDRLAAWAALATVAMLCASLLMGMAPGMRHWRQARLAGQWEARLAAYADLQAGVLLDQRPEPQAGQAWSTALVVIGAVNLPLLAGALLGGMRDLALLLLGTLVLLPALAYLLMRLAPSLPVYLALRRWEREHGRRLVSDQAARLAAIRRELPASRFLCRREELAEAERAAASSRRRKGAGP